MPNLTIFPIFILFYFECHEFYIMGFNLGFELNMKLSNLNVLISLQVFTNSISITIFKVDLI
jgi:hypothetical protein